MAMLRQRLFFALWPEAAVRDAVAAGMAPLKPKLSAQWIRPANLHITLAFLGEVEAERAALAYATADAVAGGAVALTLDRLEHWRRPQVLCLTPSATPPALEQLAADLAGRLRAAGFDLDARPYRAHLTLARKALYLPDELRWERPVEWRSASFALVESVPGAAYSVLRTWPLA